MGIPHSSETEIIPLRQAPAYLELRFPLPGAIRELLHSKQQSPLLVLRRLLQDSA
jgi:hypothetical protein